jgi:hypothetical protein
MHFKIKYEQTDKVAGFTFELIELEHQSHKIIKWWRNSR